MIKLLSIITLGTLLVGCQGQVPENIGFKIHKVGKRNKFSLTPCGKKPNCVVSYKELANGGEYLEPIKIMSNRERAFEKISAIVLKNKSAKLISQTDKYIRAEYTSSLFSFVDDVEFYFGDNGIIHFRSSSRMGYSDLSTNKKRIEEIRFKFHQNDI